MLDECYKFIYLACGVVVDKKGDHYAMTTIDSSAASTLAFLCCQFSTHSRWSTYEKKIHTWDGWYTCRWITYDLQIHNCKRCMDLDCQKMKGEKSCVENFVNRLFWKLSCLLITFWYAFCCVRVALNFGYQSIWIWIS